ncbi:MAG: hypothetical protein ACJ72X_05420 [Nitrososphaeraceae archaeon]
MTFRDLKKRLSLETVAQEQSRPFERLQNKSFWICDHRQHKSVDIRTNGKCCFNHIIGLPREEAGDKPMTSCDDVTRQNKCY